MLYREEPVDFQSQLTAVGCMVEYNGKLLFLRRHPSRRYGGKWGCPTGKQEPGEAIEETALRELDEETGISTSRSTLHYCGVRFVRYPADQDFVYHQFWLKLLRKPTIILHNGEHDRFVWVTREEAVQVEYIGETGDIHECLRMLPMWEPRVEKL